MGEVDNPRDMFALFEQNDDGVAVIGDGEEVVGALEHDLSPKKDWAPWLDGFVPVDE